MSLTIGYASDLHLEVMPGSALQRVETLANAMRGLDVVVLAGDFSSNYSSLGISALQAVTTNPLVARLSYLCDALEDTPVIMVPGNHEYYKSSFNVINRLLAEADEDIPNLHVLNNTVKVIKGQRFVGTTLWFPHRQYDVDNRLRDFSMIEDASQQIELRSKLATNLLVEEMREGDVVVTHHLPSHDCIDEMYENSPLNRFYVNNMKPLFVAAKPAAWIHGHSHTSCDMVIGSTRVVRNPYGYHEVSTNEDFSWNAFIEV